MDANDTLRHSVDANARKQTCTKITIGIVVVLVLIGAIIGILFGAKVIGSSSSSDDTASQELQGSSSSSSTADIQQGSSTGASTGTTNSDAPILLYIDTTSGPLTGGENNLGSYLSLFGKNFGAQSGLGTTTKVFIGGAEVANYRYLGPSAVYDKMGIQQLIVQLGALGSPTMGSALTVEVRVNGVSSLTAATSRSGIVFYPCSGHVLFASLSGNDATGTVNDINKPWRHLQVNSGTTGAYYGLSTAGCDHIVIRGGDWTDALGVDGTWMKFSMNAAARNGVPTGYIHITAYPGPINGNAPEDVHYTTQPDTPGGIQGPWSAIAGTSGEYVSVSNLRMEVLANADRDACPINFQYTAGPWRVTNLNLGPWKAGSSAILNCGGMAGHGHGNVINGNHIHGIEGTGDLQNHGIYADTTADNWEVGYNWIHDISGGSGIQFNDNEGGAGSYVLPHNRGIWAGFVNMSVHHNWIENTIKYGIHFNDQGSTKEGEYSGLMFNNVVIGTGLPPFRISSTQMIQELWFMYNTVYDCMTTYSYTGNAMVRSEEWSSGPGQHTYNIFYNNIFAFGPRTYKDSVWFSDSGAYPATTAQYEFRQNLYYSASLAAPPAPQTDLGDMYAYIGDPMFNSVTAGAYDFTTKVGSLARMNANFSLPASKASSPYLSSNALIHDDFTSLKARVLQKYGSSNFITQPSDIGAFISGAASVSSTGVTSSSSSTAVASSSTAVLSSTAASSPSAVASSSSSSSTAKSSSSSSTSVPVSSTSTSAPSSTAASSTGASSTGTFNAGAPILLYIDTTSGPLTGGENNLGSYLSLFGKNFGAQSGLGTTTKVFIGGAEVANYRYLGPSAVYDKMGIQQLIVQLGALGSPTMGSALTVEVRVNGVSSLTAATSRSGIVFYPCSGHVLFASLSGNDATGTVNDINKPWRHLQVNSGTTGAYYGLSTAGCDHIVIRGGDWTDALGVDGTWMKFSMNAAARNGVPTGYIHITAYPGPINGNAPEDVHYTTQPDTPGGIQGPWSAIAGTSGEYVSVSNLRMEVLANADRDACPINFQYTAGPWRVTNLNLGPWKAGSSAILNCGGMAGHGHGNVINGNHIHGIEGTGDLQNHGIYADTTADNWEVGYNWIHDISGGSGIQFNDNEGGAGSYVLPHNRGIWAGFVNMSVHHNWIENTIKYGIHFNDQGSTKEGEYSGLMFNNVVIGTGLPPFRISSTQMIQELWFMYNTVYDCMTTNSGSGNAYVRSEEWSNAPGQHTYNIFYNNIFAYGPRTIAGTYYFEDVGEYPATTAQYEFRQNLYYPASQKPPAPQSDLGDKYSYVADPMFNSVTAGSYDFTTKANSLARLHANFSLPASKATSPYASSNSMIHDDFTSLKARVVQKYGSTVFITQPTDIGAYISP